MYSTALYRPPRAGAGTMFVNSDVLWPSRARLPSGTGTAAALYLLLSTHSRRRGNTACLRRYWRGGALWPLAFTSSRRWTPLGVSAGEGGCPGRCGESGATSLPSSRGNSGHAYIIHVVSHSHHTRGITLCIYTLYTRKVCKTSLKSLRLRKLLD